MFYGRRKDNSALAWQLTKMIYLCWLLTGLCEANVSKSLAVDEEGNEEVLKEKAEVEGKIKEKGLVPKEAVLPGHQGGKSDFHDFI